MNARKERISKDKKALIKQGYKNPRLERDLNYFNDWEKAVMLYSCKTKDGIEVKYSFPTNFNIESLFNKHIKPRIQGKIKHIDMEYEDFGCRYSIVLERNDENYIVHAKVTPDLEVTLKEFQVGGDS